MNPFDQTSKASSKLQLALIYLLTNLFRFKPLTEQERLKDGLVKQELFETDSFNKNNLVRLNVHRNLEKGKWISTERGGFTVAGKVKYPKTTRN